MRATLADDVHHAALGMLFAVCRRLAIFKVEARRQFTVLAVAARHYIDGFREKILGKPRTGGAKTPELAWDETCRPADRGVGRTYTNFKVLRV